MIDKTKISRCESETEIPYFSHLISVSNNVIENGGYRFSGSLNASYALKIIKSNKVAKILIKMLEPKPPWFRKKKKRIYKLDNV